MNGKEMMANMCPDCGGWLSDTWTGFGCGRCGFFFDGDHLTSKQIEQLEEIQENYERQQSGGATTGSGLPGRCGRGGQR